MNGTDDEAHDLVMKGNGMSGYDAIRVYEQAGEMGNALGYFNAGNCLLFGLTGVFADKDKGLAMWERGAELVKRNEGKGLDRWAEESNEKVACGKELDLCGLLGITRGHADGAGRRNWIGKNINDEGAEHIGMALEMNSTITKVYLGCG